MSPVRTERVLRSAGLSTHECERNLRKDASSLIDESHSPKYGRTRSHGPPCDEARAREHTHTCESGYGISPWRASPCVAKTFIKHRATVMNVSDPADNG